jgi:hypothetical protein
MLRDAAFCTNAFYYPVLALTGFADKAHGWFLMVRSFSGPSKRN